MASEVRQLDLILKLKDEVSKDIRKASKELELMDAKTSDVRKQGIRLGESYYSAMDSIGRAVKGASIALTAGLGAAAVSVGIKSVQMAADFNKSMSNVSTLIDTSVEDMGKMKEEVLNMSTELPVSIEGLSSALYDIRSAGIDANEAMSTLNWSAKLATAGLSTTQEATNILTSAINSFAKEGLDVQKISDILFKTVKAGKTTISDLAISFGASAPVIAEAGVKLADFQAATAALTITGLPASQAQMGLRQAIVALIKPTEDMEDLFAKLGVKSGRELISTSENMGDVFKKLKDASDQNNISFEKAVGSVEALNATTGLLGESSESYKTSLGDMTTGTDKLSEAYNKQNEEASAQYQILKNQLNVEMIKLGTAVLPKLIENMRALPFLPEVWKEWKENIVNVTEAIQSMTDPITQVTNTYEAWKKLFDVISDTYNKITGNKSVKIDINSSSSGSKNVGDAIITPGGNIVETDPKDFLIATKTPGALVGAGTGGGNIVVNINGGYYLDRNAGEKIAEALSETIRRKLRL